MLTFVQGNTAPDLNAVIHYLNNDPLDLTGASVRFQMRKANDRRFTVNAAAEVIEASEGKVRYRWGPNDLGVSGEYLVQWQVTFADEREQTTAQAGRITVRRQ